MLVQQEDIKSDNQKIHEQLARLEIANLIQVRESQHILFNKLEEEATEDGSTCANKGKTKDGNLGSIKMKIPTFQGKSDLEAYLEWKKKVERVFECHNNIEEKKVKSSTVEFTNYVSVWWDQFTSITCRSGEGPITS